MGSTNSIPTVSTLKTSKGALNGILETSTQTDHPVCTRYSRVPYALPPTGSRRWQKPHALPSGFSFSNADGTPGDYTQFAPVCPQPVYGHDSVMRKNPDAAPAIERVYSEDCLYLNVWVPAGEAPAGGWPVQVFLHGGWLQVGDAMQNHNHDPFDLLHEFPRIIVAISYRLNLFGFLSHSELGSANFGFWDQRLGIEWTAENIHLFGGDASNISLGGLSAGAYSTIFQLHYDTYVPDAERVIKRAFLYSNAVGIQPDAVASDACRAQFEDLCGIFAIDKALSAGEKIDKLRLIKDSDLTEKILSLKKHTFRACTDDEFVPKSFLKSIIDGSFTSRLKKHGISIMLGEVENEELLYRLVNPASSYDSMIQQLNNYYPSNVTDALVKSGIYKLPDAQGTKDEWRDCFAAIVADCQVHATIRGFASSLLETDDPLPIDQVHRYRICWRAKGLDKWLDPAVGLCHAADVPIWWFSGKRAGFDEQDNERVRSWLRAQMQVLEGKSVNWGTAGIKQVRKFERNGDIDVVEDDLWDHGIEVWKCMANAQH